MTPKRLTVCKVVIAVSAYLGFLVCGCDADNVHFAHGKVTHQGVPVYGLKVCPLVDGHAGMLDLYCDTTNHAGNYYLYADEFFFEDAEDQGFIISVEDIDGTENGDFAYKEVVMPSGSLPAEIDIAVEAAPE